ncbi:MAG: hypothetical protein JWN23_957 [Rhodocyclales bacterium]|nr:hypothetical protein [Rhodocyclales bacterium]
MRLSLIAATLLSVLSIAPAFAEDAPAAPAPEPAALTGNMTLTSEYLYRGIAQSNNRPAIQGGFDYALPAGFYIGNWNSSITWIGDTGTGASAGIEMDLYGGYRQSFGDFSIDVGTLYYYYPGNYTAAWKDSFDNPSTLEVYSSVGYKWISLKYSRAMQNLFGNNGSKGSGYYEANGTFDLGGGFGLTAHAGHQQVKKNYNAAYSDYKIGVTKDLGYAVVGLAYSTTTAHKEFYNNSVNKNLGGDRVVLNVTKTF